MVVEELLENCSQYRKTQMKAESNLEVMGLDADKEEAKYQTYAAPCLKSLYQCKNHKIRCIIHPDSFRLIRTFIFDGLLEHNGRQVVAKSFARSYLLYGTSFPDHEQGNIFDYTWSAGLSGYGRSTNVDGDEVASDPTKSHPSTASQVWLLLHIIDIDPNPSDRAI